MKDKSSKLNMREYISIIILMVGLKATEDTPAFIYNHVQNAAWMIPILTGLYFFIPLFLLLKTLSLYKNKSLFSVMESLFGKYISFFLGLIIFVINSLAISADSRTYTNIMRAFYFTSTPNLVIYAILMFVCAYGAKKGIQHIGSVAYLVIFYTLFAFYLALILSLQDSDLSAIFPFWGPGPMKIVKEGMHHLTLFADFFILTSLIPFIKSYKDFRNGTWSAYIYIIISLSIAVLLYICLFDVTLKGMGYPYHTAIRYISIGEFLENVEILFFPLWLLGAFIRFSAFLFINALLFGHLFKIKDFEYLIPTLSCIYLLIGMIPESPIDVSLIFKERIHYLSGPTFAVISILLWLTAVIKGELRHGKNKKSM